MYNVKQATLQGGGYTIPPALFCRRNLNPNQIAYLRGKKYETEKKIWGGDRHSEEFKSSTYQNDKLTKRPQTNENLAKEYGVSPATISRSGMLPK